jgi:hypothetical protein
VLELRAVRAGRHYPRKVTLRHLKTRTTTADFANPAADSQSLFQRWISRLLIVTITAMTLQPLTTAALHSQSNDTSAIEA